jgi:hypothetical protein
MLKLINNKSKTKNKRILSKKNTEREGRDWHPLSGDKEATVGRRARGLEKQISRVL